MKFLFTFFLTFFLFANVFAQTDSEVLAKIGEQTITVRDLDAQTQAAVERLPAEISELRKRELEKEINRNLFEVEAAARKISTEKLLDLEVRSKIANPPASQVQSIYEANRSALGNLSLEEATPRIVNYLKLEQESQLSSAFAEKLKQKHKVALGIDVNSPNLKSNDVLATLSGKTIFAGAFNERLKPLEYSLLHNAFEMKHHALEQGIYSYLIMTEAKAAGVQPEEIFKREITDKMRNFSDEERMNLSRALNEKLKAKHNVRILLTEPAPPVLKISADDDPSRGNVNAPVTVVMFTDLQCPACAGAHPILESVLKQFPAEKVRFVVRDFPLTDIHPQAFRAAEAANAAHAQGKFFEYVEILYKNQKALDEASLKKYAAQIGLNMKRFEADLASGKFAAEVRKDREEGANYGIKGTPTIYVNGVIVHELSPEGFKSAIEKALTRK